MDKALKLLLCVLLCLPCCTAQVMQQTIPVPQPTWVVVQHPNDADACTTQTCTIPGGITTTAGDLLIMTGAQIAITAATISTETGDGTWTHCPSSYAAVDGGGFFLAIDCLYRLAATGVTAATFSITWTGGGTYFGGGISLIEVRRSTGTAAFDTSGATTSAGCTACAGPVLTLTGSSDYVLNIVTSTGSGSGPGGVWLFPYDVIVAGALAQAPGVSQAIWPVSPSDPTATGAVAFK